MANESTVTLSLSITEAHRIASVLEQGARRSLAQANGPDPMHPDDAQSLRVSAALADKTAEALRSLAMEALQEGL